MAARGAPLRGRLRRDGASRPWWRACPSAAWRATSRRRCSASAASRRARRRTPTAPAAFCSCTRAARRAAQAHGLLSTLAASAPGAAGPEYALEGSVFTAGALVQWLRDELGLVATAAETEALAESVPDTGGVYVVPAFTGLGAPHWDAEARGAIYGPDARHVARAGGARRAGGAGVPGARPRRGDGGRRGRAAARAEGGRRRVGERFSHAVPKRHLAHAARPSAEYGGDGARRGVSSRGWRAGSGGTRQQLRDLGVAMRSRFEPRMGAVPAARGFWTAWARARGPHDARRAAQRRRRDGGAVGEMTETTRRGKRGCR